MIVAGAPVTCTAADTAYQLSTTTLLVKTVYIQPKFSNAGVIYVGNSTLVPSTDTGIYQQLQVPAPNAIPLFTSSETESQNGLNLSRFWVASSQAGDVVYWSYDQQ